MSGFQSPQQSTDLRVSHARPPRDGDIVTHLPLPLEHDLSCGPNLKVFCENSKSYDGADITVTVQLCEPVRESDESALLDCFFFNILNDSWYTTSLPAQMPLVDVLDHIAVAAKDFNDESLDESRSKRSPELSWGLYMIDEAAFKGKYVESVRIRTTVRMRLSRYCPGWEQITSFSRNQVPAYRFAFKSFIETKTLESGPVRLLLFRDAEGETLNSFDAGKQFAQINHRNECGMIFDKFHKSIQNDPEAQKYLKRTDGSSSGRNTWGSVRWSVEFLGSGPHETTISKLRRDLQR